MTNQAVEDIADDITDELAEKYDLRDETWNVIEEIVCDLLEKFSREKVKYIVGTIVETILTNEIEEEE